jgi:hypothetical protein
MSRDPFAYSRATNLPPGVLVSDIPGDVPEFEKKKHCSETVALTIEWYRYQDRWETEEGGEIPCTFVGKVDVWIDTYEETENWVCPRCGAEHADLYEMDEERGWRPRR